MRKGDRSWKLGVGMEEEKSQSVAAQEFVPFLNFELQTLKFELAGGVPDFPGFPHISPHLKNFLFFPAAVATLCSLWLNPPQKSKFDPGIYRLLSPVISYYHLLSHNLKKFSEMNSRQTNLSSEFRVFCDCPSGRTSRFSSLCNPQSIARPEGLRNKDGAEFLTKAVQAYSNQNPPQEPCASRIVVSPKPYIHVSGLRVLRFLRAKFGPFLVQAIRHQASTLKNPPTNGAEFLTKVVIASLVLTMQRFLYWVLGHFQLARCQCGSTLTEYLCTGKMRLLCVRYESETRLPFPPKNF